MGPRFLLTQNILPPSRDKQLEPHAVSLSFTWEVPRMWRGCGLHPNDISVSSVCVCECVMGQGEECYHWSVSHPDPPLLPACTVWHERCEFTSRGCVRNSIVIKQTVCAHMICVCVCVRKSRGESSTGQHRLLPWVTLSRYPTSPCVLLFINLFISPPLFHSLFFLLHLHLFFPFWIRADTPPSPMTSPPPSPHTLLWWIILYVQTFRCSSLQHKLQEWAEMLLVHSENQAQVPDDCDLKFVTLPSLTTNSYIWSHSDCAENFFFYLCSAQIVFFLFFILLNQHFVFISP